MWQVMRFIKFSVCLESPVFMCWCILLSPVAGAGVVGEDSLYIGYKRNCTSRALARC